MVEICGRHFRLFYNFGLYNVVMLVLKSSSDKAAHADSVEVNESVSQKHQQSYPVLSLPLRVKFSIRRCNITDTHMEVTRRFKEVTVI